MMCKVDNSSFFGFDGGEVDDCLSRANTTLVGEDILTPDGLAVDWVHGLLFWTDTGLDKVSFALFWTLFLALDQRDGPEHASPKGDRGPGPGRAARHRRRPLHRPDLLDRLGQQGAHRAGRHGRREPTRDPVGHHRALAQRSGRGHSGEAHLLGGRQGEDDLVGRLLRPQRAHRAALAPVPAAPVLAGRVRGAPLLDRLGQGGRADREQVPRRRRQRAAARHRRCVRVFLAHFPF